MEHGGAAGYEDLLQFLYLTPIGVIKFERDGAIDLANPTATQLLMPLLPSGRLANVYDSLMPLIRDLRARVKCFDGKAGVIVGQERFEVRSGPHPMVLSLTVQRVNERVYMAVLENVTKLVEQDRRISAQEKRFNAILDNVREYAIFTLTLGGVIEEWNQSLLRFGGWTASDVAGRDCGVLFAPSEPDGPGAPSSPALLAEAKRSGSVEFETWLSARNGARIWAKMAITALPDETGSPDGFVVVASDLTEHKRIEDNLAELATIDPLTGAFNRRQGMHSLTTEFERRKRTGLPFAALMIDIDLFKSINDAHGHEAGDAVLRTMVQACTSRLRAIDMFIRWGGEEFLVILPGTPAEGARATAERLRAAVASLEVSLRTGSEVAFTISIGVAVPSSHDVDELLRRADEALYAAKNAGRNRVVLAA